MIGSYARTHIQARTQHQRGDHNAESLKRGCCCAAVVVLRVELVASRLAAFGISRTCSFTSPWAASAVFPKAKPKSSPIAPLLFLGSKGTRNIAHTRTHKKSPWLSQRREPEARLLLYRGSVAATKEMSGRAM